MGRAAAAVAHSILVWAYYILSRDEPYTDLGADWLARRNDEAHARRLVAQLERLGHTVILDPGRLASTARRTGDGLRPAPRLTRACNTPLHGSVCHLSLVPLERLVSRFAELLDARHGRDEVQRGRPRNCTGDVRHVAGEAHEVAGV